MVKRVVRKSRNEQNDTKLAQNGTELTHKSLEVAQNRPKLAQINPAQSEKEVMPEENDMERRWSAYRVSKTAECRIVTE
ncbi:hypothetical protein [Sporosarcina sp. ACRSL]|uniref:hypothetical protein n=1 Tax=Sporosarcina sp. ACRSL TaxID=2918215 RepID=UPI001EF60C93|nr:hypothetical protein [Sporosarcina sp. ACRSL]